MQKDYYDPKNFFLDNINMGIKKTQNFMLISNSLMPGFGNAPVGFLSGIFSPDRDDF
jgi:hypothetical protein